MGLSIDNVGVIIAYIIPGSVAMFGLAYFSPAVRRWLGDTQDNSPTIAGAVFLLLTSLGIGILSDAVRSMTIDKVHHFTGIEQASWSFSQLDETKFNQFQGIVEGHFALHQFYGNLFLAIIFTYVSRLVALKKVPWPPTWRDLGTATLLCITWAASRSDLDACYRALEELLA